ncbi:MAG: M48 family metallopeptidase [Verrucomicrobiales bacterium]|nr:M48 family metallopeptidase [Verrucomicrobiales bacterium]
MTFSNPYFTLVLAAMLAVHAVGMLATILNLKALQPELPADFQDVLDPDEYRKSQAYARESARFEMVSSTATLLVFLAFWLSGGFAWLDALVRSRVDAPVMQGLVFVSLLYLGNLFVSLPFTIYDTFVIEAKYGFNKTTPATFIADRIKGLLLGALLGLPLLALLLWVFGKYEHAWIWAWAATTAFMLAMLYIGPVWIMPLFNKFTPLQDGPLKEEVTALAQRCGFPFKEVSIIDGSKRSTHSNAFFAGFGKNKRIALYDTLVEQQTVPELTAVLAHEIGHCKRRHIIQRVILSIVHIGVLFFLFGLFLNESRLREAFGVAQPSVHVSLVLFMLVFQCVEYALGIVLSMWSRKHEYEADAYAAAAVGSAAPLISALKKLAKHNLSNLTPHPVYVFLNYSHPPLRERFAAMRRLPAGA